MTSALEYTFQPASVSTINVNSWDLKTSATPMTTAAPKSVRGKRKAKEVIYPIFAYYASLFTDIFWIEIFTQAATGKLPKKFSFSEMTLSYNKGQKEGSLPLYQTPESAQMALQFFRTLGAIYSPTDQRNALFQHQECQTASEPLTWASASRKTKIALVSNYVGTLQKLMNLSEGEIKQLAETINLGIGGKLFNRNNINVDQHKITAIIGLCWDEIHRIFYADPDIKPLRANSRAADKNKQPAGKKGNTPSFRLSWNKFLTDQIHGRQLNADQQQAFNMIVMMSKSSLSQNSEDSSYLSDSEGEDM